jgi:para-aminobenzoate synthetase component 1
MPVPDWINRMNEYGRTGIPFLFILDFDLLNPLIIPFDEIEKHGLKFQFPSMQKKIVPSLSHEMKLEKTPVSYETYARGFQQVMRAIQAGDTYLLNLCYTTPVSGITSLEHVFEMARAPYTLCVPGKFVVFSPEQFVSISDGEIRTFPMKGTIDASVPNARQVLLEDVKEQEEHATVVDLLRNDLSMVARHVTVERYRYITEIKTPEKTLLQCSSSVSGTLDAGYRSRLGDIIGALLPAGSVTGAPKRRTVELIREIELEPRGYYTGVFGWFDGNSLESAVMIRMIEQREDGFYYRSGGGITYRSEARAEYQEMVDKVYVPL